MMFDSRVLHLLLMGGSRVIHLLVKYDSRLITSDYDVFFVVFFIRKDTFLQQ